MLFKYTGYTKDGKKVSSSIEALNIQIAKSQLKHNNIVVTKISENNFNFFNKIFKKTKKNISPLVLSTISRDLSMYLNSGISLLNSIKLISQRYQKDKVLNPFFQSIIAYLDEGKNFYTSLEKQDSINIPEFYLQSIKISEDGGILKTVLIELSDYLKEEYRLKKQITQSMTYPIFIVVVAIAMLTFMLTFIVPKITAIFEQNGQELPEITTFIINLGDFVAEYIQIILILFVIFILLFSLAMKKIPSFKYKVDYILLKIPFLGSIIQIDQLARFAYMNSILIKSGVPVVQAFQMGAGILNNSVLKNLFNTASKKVVEGEKLSNILDNSKIYKIDIAFIQAIAIGEETSNLNKVLENLAELYNTTNKDKIASFLALLEPMLMLIVGGAVGFILIATLLPIFSMSIN
jgi:general secretion pathway protein F/type IV pilus assembly protein PilC